MSLLCRFTLQQTHFRPLVSCSYFLHACAIQNLCAVGHHHNLNNEHYVLILLLAKDNPLWLHVAVVGSVKVAKALERYGYEITKHIPAGDIIVNEGEIYGDSPQLV